MKQLLVTAPGESTVNEVPVPQPQAGEVLVKIMAITTCPQWDLHLRHNEPMFVGHTFHYPYTPGQPGHEATGYIEAIGTGVTELQVGDRVSIWKDPGHDRPGCYAQYAVFDAQHVIAIDDALPYQATASLELAMCVGASFLMLHEMDVINGERFAVNGLGPAGLIAAQMAKAEGASEVVGFDFVASRRELALTTGVDAAYDPREDLNELFPSRTSHLPSIYTGIDCVGAKASVEYLMDRTESTVALFGVQREPYTYAPYHYRQLRLCGYPGHSLAAAQYAKALIEDGKLDLKPLVTHELPLEDYDHGVALLERQEAIKVCFLPWA